MKITIKTVAERANVSVATVSHVLNNTRPVSTKTRERVEQVIRELGYKPNMTARNFKAGKNNAIGIIVPDIANYFFASIIEEVEAIVGKQGYTILIANTKETQSKELQHIQMLSSSLVDGLIIASTFDDYDSISNQFSDDFPVVFIDRIPKKCSRDCITISDETAMRSATESLISSGHRRIGYIAGLDRLSTTTERLNTYRSVLKAHDLNDFNKYICYANSMANSANDYLDDLISAGCTAIIVSNNVMTNDVIRRMRNIEKQNITIMGYFDDVRDISPNSGGIVQPSRDIGKAAGKQMIERINDIAAPSVRISIESIFNQSAFK